MQVQSPAQPRLSFPTRGTGAMPTETTRGHQIVKTKQDQTPGAKTSRGMVAKSCWVVSRANHHAGQSKHAG